MPIQHNVIPDAERHEAKGASTAIAGQVLKANGDGSTSFVAPNTLSNIAITSTLEAISTTTQNPAGTDTPYQVVFGGGTSNTQATVASNGIVTINEAGLYLITVDLNFSRANNVGLATMVARVLINGVATNFIYPVKMDTSINFDPTNITIFRSFAATDTITVQIIRDSGGANDGGLYTFNPVLAGWADTPSALIRIQKITGAA